MRSVKMWYFKKVAVILVFAIFVVGSIPAKSMADMAGMATGSGQTSLDRATDMDNVQRVLESKIISGKLARAGYSAVEVKTRLDKLSDAELHSFSQQVNSLYPGGDGGLSILAALLVILIIVLVVLKMTDRKIIIK